MSGKISKLIVKGILTRTNSTKYKFLSGMRLAENLKSVKFGKRQKLERPLTNMNLGARSNDAGFLNYGCRMQGNRVKRRQDEDVVSEFPKMGQNEYADQNREEALREKVINNMLTIVNRNFDRNIARDIVILGKNGEEDFVKNEERKKIFWQRILDKINIRLLKIRLFMWRRRLASTYKELEKIENYYFEYYRNNRFISIKNEN